MLTRTDSVSSEYIKPIGIYLYLKYGRITLTVTMLLVSVTTVFCRAIVPLCVNLYYVVLEFW